MTTRLKDLLSDDGDVSDAAQRQLATADEDTRRALLEPLRGELAKRLKTAAEDVDFHVAAAALLHLRLPEAEAAVAALTEHPEDSVRSMVPSLYDDHHDGLPTVLRDRLLLDSVAEVRTSVYQSLESRPSGDAVGSLLEAAQEPQDDERDLLLALGACARLSSAEHRSTVVNLLAAKLDRKKPVERETAMAAIARLGTGSPAIVEKLLGMADAKRPQTRFGAVGALAALDDDTPSRVRALVVAGAKGNADESACAATVLNFNLDVDIVMPVLHEALVDANPRIRAFAAGESVLRRERIERIDIDRLTKLLIDDDERVRAAAAAAAGALAQHANRLGPVLRELLKDKSRKVKRAAKEALETLGLA